VHIPGAEARFFSGYQKRPKAEALGYQEAMATAETDPYGMTNQRTDLGVEGGYGGYYGLLFVVAKFGIHGECQDFGGGFFGVGEVAFFISEIG
jgi:hypothetical protein